MQANRCTSVVLGFRCYKLLGFIRVSLRERRLGMHANRLASVVLGFRF